MVKLKTWEEIQIMMKSGEILRKSVDELLPQVHEGMTTSEVDELAERIIRNNGGLPSFKKVPGYTWTTCLPINEQIVHTTPTERKLKKGDLLTIDIGVYYQGFHTDYATSFVIGESSKPEISKFLEVGEKALDKAIEVAKKSAYIGEISQSIEQDIYGNGYFILHELTGHGIGKDLHEAPYVPGVLDRPIEKTYKIQSGLVIAVEVIYSMGTEEIKHEEGDDWSIVTSDGSISACFEKTIAFFGKKTFILT